MSRNTIAVVLLITGLVTLSAVLIWQFRYTWQEPVEISGIYLKQAKAIAEFQLSDDSKQVFNQDSLAGDWKFLYFGYTFCPDACPLALAQLNKVEQQLAKQQFGQAVGYILVSVDPRRDTPERLAEYTRFFNAKFRGVTGEPTEIKKFADSIGIYYSVPENPEDPENYLVDHSSAIVLINPQGKMQALFTPPHDPVKIAADFAAIQARFSNQ